MKISIILVAFSAVLFLRPSQVMAQNDLRNYELDEAKSIVTWSAKLENEKFSGQFKIKNGYLNFAEKELSEGVVFVNTQSITCKECRDSETARKILEFITSDDFLKSQKMDFAVFKMYKSDILENSKDGNYRIEGALTIIGYSNTISLPVTILEKKGRVYLDGKLTINRALWELNNPKGSNPEQHIGQTIELYIHLEGALK
jgi:polyisoprenoid-binding protein YceI